MLAENGALADMIAAGARIIECGCGPCIGMGQSPKTNAVSLRTNNRNFYGRSGTKSASIYLVSPEVAAVAAITGVVTDPADFGEPPVVEMPDSFLVSDNMVIIPSEKSSDIEVVRGPNIKPFPMNHALGDTVEGKVLIKLEDNITTDHIMPSNSKLLPYRSNVPYLADYCLTPCDDRCESQITRLAIPASRRISSRVVYFDGARTPVTKSIRSRSSRRVSGFCRMRAIKLWKRPASSI